MSQNATLLQQTALELEGIAERLQEIADWASEEDYLAITHKIEEGVGRIEHAAQAALQYDDGTLPEPARPAPWGSIEQEEDDK